MTDSNQNLSKEAVINRIVELMNNMSKNRLLFFLAHLEDKPVKWKRKSPRKSCFISVDYDTLDYSGNKRIHNLSTSGAYIEAGESFALEQDIILWLSAPDEENPFIKIPAKVVRRDREGIGVEFDQLTDDQHRIIKKIEKAEEI
ncbi:MAG: PilZ domain-containing protein [Deltaproteobacteria bacterium]|nr:PilZ domain-containing protein [Deltaproteobacteria bacterium]MBW2219913.1 PilZ domain-containing protein [Deltaproteobacteria bacterium]